MGRYLAVVGNGNFTVEGNYPALSTVPSAFDSATRAMFIATSIFPLPIIRPSSVPNRRAAFSALTSATTIVVVRIPGPKRADVPGGRNEFGALPAESFPLALSMEIC
jgi:hypothetical protein